MKNKVIRYSALVLLIVWACLIFHFSTQSSDASTNTSGGVVEKMVVAFYPEYDSLDATVKRVVLSILMAPVRKTAHFGEFAVLGALFFVFYSTFEGVIKKHIILISVLSGLLYAISDEIHQYFVPGRSCRALDVCIDLTGVLSAVFICYLINWIWRRIKIGQQEL